MNRLHRGVVLSLVLSGLIHVLPAQAQVPPPLWRTYPPTIDGNAYSDGQWDGPDDLAIASINAALSSAGTRGRLILWGKDRRDNPPTYYWDFVCLDLDPAASTRTFTYDHPQYDHHPFCAGQAFYRDPGDGGKEKLLIVGGPYWNPQTVVSPAPSCPAGWTGDMNTSVVSILDPSNPTSAGVSMGNDIPSSLDNGHVRWYPTCLPMPDGRILVSGGNYWNDADGDHCDDDGDKAWQTRWIIYDPARSSGERWVDTSKLDNLYLYPHLFWIDGNSQQGHVWPQGLFWTGASFVPPATANSMFWDMSFGLLRQDARTPALRDQSSAVLFSRSGYGPNNSKVLLLGGNDRSDPPLAYNTAQVFDFMNLASDPWSDTPAPMNRQRTNCNTVLLPNGQVFVVGGEYWASGVETAELSNEMYDPATGQFTLKASMARRNHLNSSNAWPHLVSGRGMRASHKLVAVR